LAEALEPLEEATRAADELSQTTGTACRTEITKTEVVECDAAMKAHIESLDFSIFKTKPLLRIIDGHAKTRWYRGAVRRRASTAP
jgi:hypothetical protein